MRYVILCLLFILIPFVLPATECNSSCTFIRGDANCSGAADFTDVSNIGSGYINNYDAADVNDNGTVNGSDATQLSYWLMSGPPNPPPSCPYSGYGIDSSGDSLEVCCSPPTFKLSPEMSSCAETLYNFSDPDDWDYTWHSNGTVGDHCYGYAKVENEDGQENPGCAHVDSKAEFDVVATANDTSYWTKRRLQNQVQRAYLHIEIEAWPRYGSRCLDTPCNFTNRLLVEVIPDYFIAYVESEVASGGSGPTITVDDYDDELELKYWTYLQNGQCTGWGELRESSYHVDMVREITTDLANAASGNCTAYKITEVQALNLALKFSRLDAGGQKRDIAEEEIIEVEMYPWIEYTWDTCP